MKYITLLMLLVSTTVFADTKYDAKISDRQTEKEKYQVIRYKDTDNIERWRDVYSGPKGDGYIEWESKSEDGKKYVRGVHVGPEDRQVPKRWTEVIVSDLI